MKPVLWVGAASVLSYFCAAMVFDRRTSLEILCGMLGPLAIVTSTSFAAERVYARNPEGLTSLMIIGFAGKMVFFGAYVAVMLLVFSLRPVPFVASFTSYFVVLYLTEALCLRRMFLGRAG